MRNAWFAQRSNRESRYKVNLRWRFTGKKPYPQPMHASVCADKANDSVVLLRARYQFP